MTYRFYISIFTLLFLFSCKKDTPLLPANNTSNNNPDDCTTCPSIFHNIEDLAEPTTYCDDFTDDVAWPDGFFNTADEVVGMTQNGTQPITVQSGGICVFDDMNPGMYGIGPVHIAFDGSYQTAVFEIYGFAAQYGEMSVAVNGSTPINLDESFPIEVGGVPGVMIDLDFSAPDSPPSWENAYLTFTGNLSGIEFDLFESGFISLCVTNAPSAPTVDKTHYVYVDDFVNHAGEVLGSYPNTKTPLGYYGLQPASLNIDFSQFLAYSPTKIGFVHAHQAGEDDYLVNIQLNGTPLIVTQVDSLADRLSPYGYTLEKYSYTGTMWSNQSTAIAGMQIDSFLVKGNNINQLSIGAELSESELRSICTYYENN
ncbi:MAG: hypothetical protein MI810_06170 [Flavobacteriales bacterium]|nr:hypothetical protein [Flavobacteriales bacterium]